MPRNDELDGSLAITLESVIANDSEANPRKSENVTVRTLRVESSINRLLRLDCFCFVPSQQAVPRNNGLEMASLKAMPLESVIANDSEANPRKSEDTKRRRVRVSLRSMKQTHARVKT